VLLQMPRSGSRSCQGLLQVRPSCVLQSLFASRFDPAMAALVILYRVLPSPCVDVQATCVGRRWAPPADLRPCSRPAWARSLLPKPDQPLHQVHSAVDTVGDPETHTDLVGQLPVQPLFGDACAAHALMHAGRVAPPALSRQARAYMPDCEPSYSPLTLVGSRCHPLRRGAVMTRLDVYSDFRPFFQANPSGVYMGPDKTSALTDRHAVLLVGAATDVSRGTHVRPLQHTGLLVGAPCLRAMHMRCV
jgi:hypothetical protein